MWQLLTTPRLLLKQQHIIPWFKDPAEKQSHWHIIGWKDHKSISKALWCRMNHSENHYPQNGENLEQWWSFLPTFQNYSRVYLWFIQEFTKDPRTSSKELQASLFSVRVRVHDSKIRIRNWAINGLHGKV